MHDDNIAAQAAPPADEPAPDTYAQAARDAEFAALAERAARVGYTTVRLGPLVALHRPVRSIFAGSVIEAQALLDDEAVGPEGWR